MSFWEEGVLRIEHRLRLTCLRKILPRCQIFCLLSFLFMVPVAHAETDLSANDVSILFPVPDSDSSVAEPISLADLKGAPVDGVSSPVWSAKDFGAFIVISERFGDVVGTGRAIGLPASVKTIDAWKIAGIRIDPGAPGLSEEIGAQFGQQPQIRLIAQPVTDDRGVHDITAHLIYSYSTPAAPAAEGCLPRSVPDTAKFSTIVQDAVALRDKLAQGQFGGMPVDTAGKPLGVHPGLVGPTASDFRDAVRAFLEKHLTSDHLTSMAVMALDRGAPEPWIFVAMQKREGSFVPVPNPVLDGIQRAQMLSFVDFPRVQPVPHNDNRNPITCRVAAFQRPPTANSERNGVATAAIFDNGVSGESAKEIFKIIADPTRSHFFNTDCISCHTETRKAMEVAGLESVPGVDSKVLPKEAWNVRNFGWFPSFFRRGKVEPTVTRRTALETAEVVEFINEHF